MLVYLIVVDFVLKSGLLHCLLTINVQYVFMRKQLFRVGFFFAVKLNHTIYFNFIDPLLWPDPTAIKMLLCLRVFLTPKLLDWVILKTRSEIFWGNS